MRELEISDPTLYSYQVKDDRADAVDWQLSVD
jgi:hypothetical protein